jgi:AP-3 complex subunit sigma
VQQRLITEIFTLVSNRPSSSCNFLPLPPLLAASAPANSQSTTGHTDLPALITYRHYATLYFIMISTSTESPLALLDLIQAFVESLDKLFENVCELDLIFNFETLHAALGEMIVGGVVVETSSDKVIKGVKEQGRVPQRKEAGKSGGYGGGILGWGGAGLRGIG